MSKDEVLKAIAELKQTYEPVTIDITPEGEESETRRGKKRKQILEHHADAADEQSPEVDTDAD